jgi:hypothetical protein
MRKVLLVIFLAAYCSCLSFGQNIKGEEQKFTYVRLPLKPLPASIKTYKLETLVPNFPANSYSFNRTSAIAQLNKSLKLDGYESSTGAADLEMYVKVEPFYYSSPSMRSRTVEETRDKATIRVTYYWLELQYNLPVYFRMTNKIDNAAIFDSYVAGSREYATFRTPEFRTSGEASNYYESQKSGHLQKMIENSFNDAASWISDYVRNNHDFAQVAVKQEVLTARAKKEDYSDLDTAQAIALRAYALIKPDRNSGFADFAAAIQPALDTWVKVLQEADVNNKRARVDAKVANAIMHNLSDAYIWLNEFDKANEMITKADENGKRDYWVDEARKTVADRRNRKTANQQSSSLSSTQK